MYAQEGEVIPVSVTIGDKVLVPEYGGTKLKFEDEVSEYLVCQIECCLRTCDCISPASLPRNTFSFEMVISLENLTAESLTDPCKPPSNLAAELIINGCCKSAVTDNIT